MSVTPLYAGLLALLFLALSINVIRRRRALGISVGDGGDPRFARHVRAHGNFVDYVPLVLLLMALLELGGLPAWILHAQGITLLAGRLLHAACFVCTETNLPMRVSGMMLTFVSLVWGAVFCLFLALG